MNELFWFAAGVCFTAIADWVVRFLRRKRANARRSEAVSILRKHNLSPQLYLASIDVEDDELRKALDEFAYSGHVVMNVRGEVIGKVVPRVNKGPHLKLVTTNVP